MLFANRFLPEIVGGAKIAAHTKISKFIISSREVTLGMTALRI